MINFFEKAGKAVLGSRLRLITEQITADAALICDMYGIPIQPKWYPVYFVLANESQTTITELARSIGHSHPSVSKIIKEMGKAGLVYQAKDVNDGRKNIVRLTNKAISFLEPMNKLYMDVSQAVDQLLSQCNNDLWAAIGEFEYLLEEKALVDRVKEFRRDRESTKIKIIDYEPIHASFFRILNETWISKHFKLEASDHAVLDDPDASIIKKGGHILVALYDDVPVGVCALIKVFEEDYDYELAKMAVSPEVQGFSIGQLLAKAAVEKSKKHGAKKIYLESNTILKSAITIYKKLGFVKVTGKKSPYDRCNIQMQLEL